MKLVIETYSYIIYSVKVPISFHAITGYYILMAVIIYRPASSLNIVEHTKKIKLRNLIFEAAVPQQSNTKKSVQ